MYHCGLCGGTSSTSACRCHENERKTVAVLKRLLPSGDSVTDCKVVTDDTTVGELNRWSDRLCAGKTTCLSLELVEQFSG